MTAIPKTIVVCGSGRSDERTRLDSVKIGERQVGAVTILDLEGTITIDDGVERLKDKINSLILQQRTSMVLNLAESPTSTVAVSANWCPPTARL